MKEPLVVYIIGDNRSGTTLLDYLLSWHPEALSVGEMHNLNGFFYKTSQKNFHNWACSCGEPVSMCPFWSSIIASVDFSENFITQIKTAAFIEPKSSYLSPGAHEKNTERAIHIYDTPENGKQVAANCWSLYKSIFKETGKSVIIDSSKNGFQAYFLNKYKEGNIRFLVMERDVDAVAYSKLNRVKKGALGKKKPICSYIISSRKILRKNRILAKKIDRIDNRVGNGVMSVDYMSLTENPVKMMNSIFSFLGMSLYDVPTYTNVTRADQLHTVGGSPSRFEQTRIEPDIRYKAYYKGRPMARFFGYLFG